MHILIFIFLDSRLEGRTVSRHCFSLFAFSTRSISRLLSVAVGTADCELPPFKYLQTAVGPVFRYCDGLPVEGAWCERRLWLEVLW